MLKKLLMIMAVAATFVLPHASDCMAAETGYVPQISNERGIKVTVIPQNISNGAKTWDFEVTLETHSQALSDDLTTSSVLIADGVKNVPLAWEGAPPGGHHRKGVLRFKAIMPQPAAMELQIRLAGDSLPRSFKWQLK
jgi:hypothetical protein